MKKPFVLLRRPKDIVCLAIAVALSVMALFLFKQREAVTSVGGEGQFAPVGIFGLMERNL